MAMARKTMFRIRPSLDRQPQRVGGLLMLSVDLHRDGDGQEPFHPIQESVVYISLIPTPSSWCLAFHPQPPLSMRLAL